MMTTRRPARVVVVVELVIANPWIGRPAGVTATTSAAASRGSFEAALRGADRSKACFFSLA
jgi:hypothetical protein